MCLIAYSPTGTLLPRHIYDYARRENPDGIGIMSRDGVGKFVGKKAAKKAWALLRRIAADKIPYAIHFRWRTHGPVNRQLCHPFLAQDDNTLVMHNGIIHATSNCGKDESDTQVFVRDFVDLPAGMSIEAYKAELKEYERFIGYGNKLCILDKASGEFSLCNEYSGSWIKGFWYSNEYSLPFEEQTDTYHAGMRSRYYQTPNYLALNQYSLSDDEENVLDRALDAVRQVPRQQSLMLPAEKYYREIEDTETPGYFEDGTMLGTMAAYNKAIDAMEEKDADRDYRSRLRIAATSGRGY